MELGMTRSDKTRLWIFGILFVVVLGTFLGLRLYASSGEGKAERDGGGPGDVIDLAPHEPATALPVTAIDPAWKKEIREDDLEQEGRLERPYWLLLNYVRHLGPEGYAALRQADGFEIEAFPAGTGRLLLLRDRFRLRFVALDGRIDAVSFDDALGENPGKIQKRFRAVLVLPDGSRARLDGPAEPSAFPADLKAARARVEGIFYKRVRYRTEGGEEAELPLVVVAGLYAGEGEPR